MFAKRFLLLVVAVLSCALILGLLGAQMNATSDQVLRHDSDCLIETTDFVPEGSVVVIGHAYGEPDGGGDFLSNAVEDFLSRHSETLHAVIFSGDVFSHAHASKWARLKSFSDTLGVEMFVAPGNHDVGIDSPELHTAWESSAFGYPKTEALLLNMAGFAMVLENSVNSAWHVTDAAVSAFAKLPEEAPKILIRHNIPIVEMARVANSRAGLKGELPTYRELLETLPDQTTVIAGDTGAFKGLPRLSCFGGSGLRILASGVGDLPGDGVLILSGGEITFFPL